MAWAKYGNRKVTRDGMTFDSVREYRRWCELKLMEKAGLVADIERQKPYVLIPSQKGADGKVVERECRYVADFVYRDLEHGCTVCEDTKGFRTKDYIIKRKLMLWVHGIRIREI